MTSEVQLKEIWLSLESYLRATVDKLREEFPDIWPVISWWKNTEFLFVGYASLFVEHDPARTEDCVMIMEVVRSRDRIVVRSDISSGHGDLFATGPSLSISDAEPADAQMEFLRSAESSVEEFFTDNLGEVRRALIVAEQ